MTLTFSKLGRWLAVCGAVACVAVAAQAQEAPGAPRGGDVYDSACAHCHGVNGQGGPLGPSILQRVGDTDDEALAAFLRAGVPQRGMPPAPVADEEMGVLVGYLRFLDAAADASAPSETERTVAGAGITAFRPVTEAVRQAPDAADWLDVGRVRDGRRYSPLAQINADNAGRLQLAWSRGLPDGEHAASALVYAGVMYVAMPDASVAALDAATGDVIWQAARDDADDAADPSRGYTLSLLGEALYLSSDGATLGALDARTGARLERPAEVQAPAAPAAEPAQVLATGGGLLFSADAERRYRAADAGSGEVVWQAILGGPIATDLSYAVDGRQHVAVIVGATPAPGAAENALPDATVPGTTYVFALPGAGEQANGEN